MYSKYVLYLSKWFNVLFHFLVKLLQAVFYNKKQTLVILNKLLNCKQNTLGNALVNCLNKHKLTLVPFFSTHDVKHILLGYKMTIIDEILMQCFMMGNGNKSPVTIGIAALGLHFPHLYNKMVWHYKQGQQAKCICDLQFYNIIDEPINEIRKKYNLKLIKCISY